MRKQRIKIFTSTDIIELEQNVNHFINQNVKEIKKVQLKEIVLSRDKLSYTILLVYI